MHMHLILAFYTQTMYAHPDDFEVMEELEGHTPLRSTILFQKIYPFFFTISV